MKDLKGSLMNPGSDLAVKKGCMCPILDNGHGMGIGTKGKPAFYISPDCPLHGNEAKVNSNRSR